MFGSAQASQLAQTRPSSTSAVSAFTARIATELTLIVVANTSGASATFRIYHDDDGSTFDETTALFWDIEVLGGQSVTISTDGGGSGISIAAAGQIGVRTSVASALTFTLYGLTANRAQR